MFKMYEIIDSEEQVEKEVKSGEKENSKNVRIILPRKHGFFHALARASGYKGYLLATIKPSREDLVEKMREELADSLDLPADPLNSTITNYEFWNFERPEAVIRNEIINDHHLSPPVIGYIAAYLNIVIEMCDKNGKVDYVTTTKGAYKIKIGRTLLDYYLIGSLEFKRLKVRTSEN